MWCSSDEVFDIYIDRKTGVPHTTAPSEETRRALRLCKIGSFSRRAASAPPVEPLRQACKRLASSQDNVSPKDTARCGRAKQRAAAQQQSGGKSRLIVCLSTAEHIRARFT